MRHLLLFLALALGSAAAASAQCFADYTASRSAPYDVHYGVAEVRGECSTARATTELEKRLAQAGWQLLEVRGTFDEAGAEERRADAGDHYLRY